MNRTVTVSINSCYTCPHLETADGFADYQYHCPLLNRTSIHVDGGNETWDEAHAMLTDWFTKFCPLPLTQP